MIHHKWQLIFSASDENMYQLLTVRKTMPAVIPPRSEVKIEEEVMNSVLKWKR